MGKNKKFKGDIWDLTPEEQMMQTEALYDAESGKGSILSMYDNIHSGVDENGLSIGISDLIMKKFGNTNKIDTRDYNNSFETNSSILDVVSYSDDEDIQVNQYDIPAIVDTPDDELVQVQQYDVTTNNDYNNRKIRFVLHKDLNRMVVDDGVAPTAFSFNIGLERELIVTEEDIADEKIAIENSLYDYSISLKHPTAIFKYGENNDLINCINTYRYDHDKFFFLDLTMSVGEYLLCYEIDKESKENVINFMNEQSYSEIQKIQIYTAMAFTVGTYEQAFFTDEEAYILSFYSSDYNKKDEFLSSFMSDISAFIKKTPEEYEEDFISNIRDVQNSVRSIVLPGIDRLTNENYSEYDDDDDEDEDDDIDEFDIPEDNENDITEEVVVEAPSHVINTPPVKPVNNVIETVTDASSMLSDDAETVAISSDDDISDLDNFVIPTVKRNI